MIPKEIREKLNIRPGTRCEIEEHEGVIIIKPVKDYRDFIRELKGCVKKTQIAPLAVKKIWKT